MQNSKVKGRALFWDTMTKEEKIVGIESGVRAGMSASQIAVMLNARTRNQIIGFAHRHKVELAPPKNGRAVARNKQKNAKSKKGLNIPRPARERRKVDKVVSAPKVKPVMAPKLPVVLPSPAPEEDRHLEHIHLLKVERGQCRFPLWDDDLGNVKGRVKVGDAVFCGCPVLEGSSYCSTHHARVWLKPETKKRREKVLPIKDNSRVFR